MLKPLYDPIAAHVLVGERLHGDDTTVPVLAKGKTATGRAWVYVRDDRPFAGADPPAALFFYSRDRSGKHPEPHLAYFGGILQADAYAGYNGLYEPSRQPQPLAEALCWAHARCKFFVLANIASKAKRSKQSTVISPMAVEAVKRIDALFDIERESNGLSAEAPRWKPGCAENARGCHAMPRWPRPWTISSSVGRTSPAFSRTAASA